jgi:hypothetical protein
MTGRRTVLDHAPGKQLCRALALGLLALFASTTLAPAENREIAARRATERKTFTDAEIVEGFLKISFGSEYNAGRVDRIRKYDSPVRIYIDNRARPDRRARVTTAVDDIRRRIRHLDLSVTDKRDDANVIVTLVHDRDLVRTLRAMYGREQAQRIQRSLDPQCLASFRKDDSFRILHSDVVLVSDAGEFVFYDCLYEELLQALGPINDDASVPWSMFNDEVQFGYFGIYDQYLLNLLYHPRIRPGMSREEVQAVLPEILPEVRAWVAEVNRLSE